MAQSTPPSTSYVLLSTLTILCYDIVTHLDEEIDCLARSKSASVKVIYILCRYLPFVIGALRIPTDIIGAEVCLALLRSSIWLCVAEIACVEFFFMLRTYALWGCSKGVLLLLVPMYLATCVAMVILIQRYTEYPIQPGGSCYTGGYNSQSATALFGVLLCFLAQDIVLFGITMYRVVGQYRTASGRLLNLFVGHNIVYFAASVALSGFNIILLLDPVTANWQAGDIELAQILFQGLLATRMQLHLWKADRRTVDPTMDTITMVEFAVGTQRSLAPLDC